MALTVIAFELLIRMLTATERTSRKSRLVHSPIATATAGNRIADYDLLYTQTECKMCAPDRHFVHKFMSQYTILHPVR